MRPLYEKLPAGSKLIYTEPTEAFFLKLKIALLAGVVIGAPLIMLQLWLFISPGLYAREKRFALPFILMASLFFVGGAASITTSCSPSRGCSWRGFRPTT